MDSDKTNNNKKKLLEALEASLGIISEACKRAGINRCTYYDWMNNDPAFKASAADMKEVQKDFVENQLIKNIRKGKEASIIFYLKTQCKDRGYSEKDEMIHNFGSTFSGFTVNIKRNHDQS